jgi:hypothetical protein
MLMEAERQSQVAFHLTGIRPAAGLEAVDSLALRPALLARYRDLSALRYDFPLVLVDHGADGDRVQALSGVVDRLLQDIAQGDEAERMTWHVLRLERQLRVLLADDAEGSLSTLWGTRPLSVSAQATNRCGTVLAGSTRSQGRRCTGRRRRGAARPSRCARVAWRAGSESGAVPRHRGKVDPEALRHSARRLRPLGRRAERG